MTIAILKANYPGGDYDHASSNGTAITTGASTVVVAAPPAGHHLKIYRIQANNSGAVSTTVSWRDGSAGDKLYPAHLPQNGLYSLNLGGAWELSTTKALFLFTSTSGASVEYHVDYLKVKD